MDRIYSLAHIGVNFLLQMANGFNRLTPPSGVSGNGQLKTPGPTLHPWDKMRYTWRGSLGICIRQMDVAFGATVDPTVTIQSERIELKADELDIKVLIDCAFSPLVFDNISMLTDS